MTTNINDNVVQVKFNTPIETDYVVITSLQFPKIETWGWPSVTEMVYNKTSTGFTMDVWNSHQEYQHIQCTINWIAIPLQHSVSRIIKTKQIDTTTDLNGYFETGLNARQIPIGIGGMYDARYAFHTGSDAQQGRTIRLMAWDGSAGKYSNRKINVIVYYIEV